MRDEFTKYFMYFVNPSFDFQVFFHSDVTVAFIMISTFSGGYIGFVNFCNLIVFNT